MKTTVINEATIQRKWFIIDANGAVLGRLASQVAYLIQGKGKPAYSPNQDHGDNIIIVNADKVRLTSDKEVTKTYFTHRSTQPGGGKFRSYKEQMELDSTKVVYDAIHGMLPKRALGRSMIKKLHIYSDGNHPHVAQKPEAFALSN